MSVPIRMKQLGLKDSKRPSGDDNKGFTSKSVDKGPFWKHSDWEGKTKGKTKHTYKAGE